MTHDVCDPKSPRCFSMILDKQLARMHVTRNVPEEYYTKIF
jgi:hypothetical protein